MTIFLIILFFVVLIHKPTYVWRHIESERKTYAARVPLWIALWGLIECEPETFAIIPRSFYNEFYEMIKEQEQ